MVKPRVSVVVTCFNREKFLADAIESVLAGSFEEFELIVVDDASTDDSVEIAQSYVRADERVRLVVNETNLGDYPNRNHALNYVAAPYLKYHDSDDLMYPHCLETLVALLDDAPDAGFALSSSRAWRGGPCPMLLSPQMAYRREFLGGGLFHCGPAGALFRTDVLRARGGFPSRGAASDFYFWISACQTTSALLVPGDLFWYRVHDGQELASPAAAREYATTTGESWRALGSPDCPLSGDDLRQAKRACTHQLLRLCYQDARAGRWSLIRVRVKAAGIRFRDFVRFPPKRRDDPKTGSPVDDDGDYVVPVRLGEPREADVPEKQRPKLHSMQR